VRRPAQSGILTIVGMTAASAAYSGLFLNFVKPSLRWPLIAAGVVLLVIGAYGIVVGERAAPPMVPAPSDQGSDEPVEQRGDDQDGHSHAHGPRVGWLLVLPFLMLGVVVPPPLGAFSAAQDSGIVPTTQSADEFPPMAAGTPVDLSLSEYSVRALYDESKSLQGRTVHLVGFVSPRRGGAGWVLTRMVVSCCAADGYAVKVDVQGGQRFPVNAWVEVEGTWVPSPRTAPGAPEALPIVRVTRIGLVAKPANPYE
jgi:uncharacterized repeat protein (TIGR03943 family)